MPQFMAIILGFTAIGTSHALAASTAATRPARPTTPVAMSGCVTSECHATVKSYRVLHGPVNLNTCDACHKLTDPKAHIFEISRQKAELCTYCHDFDTGGMPVIHKPVITGECLGCHNPHGGPANSLMREKSMAELCARCHDVATMQKRFMHKPVKDGECDSCHQPHASKYPKLVDAVGQDLCLFCHKDFKAQMAKVKFTHKATEKGCCECHGVHGTDFPKHVTKSLPDLCMGCHEKVKTDTAAAMYKHPAVMGNRACMTCHTAHGGDLAKLLADVPLKICVNCHDKPIKDSRGQTVVAVSEVADPAMFKHGPIRDGQCGGCHSIHGGDRPLLLKKGMSTKFYDKFSADNYELCFSCHDPQLAASEQSHGLTSFRNGDHNLHFAHVNMPPKGRNCRVCHYTHAGKQQQDIRETVPFGKWLLPIAFRKTDTGGSCETGCHVNYAYDRNNPVAIPSRPVPTTRPTVDHAEPVLARWSGAISAAGKSTFPIPLAPAFSCSSAPSSPRASKW